MELSLERIRNDELELHYYGFSSTQIYINYRETIDNRLKLLMLEIAKSHDEMSKEEPEVINKILLEQYDAFWIGAEASLQKFYEEIQKILALPKDFVPKDFVTPKDAFCDAEIKKITEEIRSLEEQYTAEKYYLHALAQRKEVIETTCIPLKTQVDKALKLLSDSKKKMEIFDEVDNKRSEMMEKCLEGMDKKKYLELMRGEKSEEKGKEIMEKFMQMTKQEESTE